MILITGGLGFIGLHTARRLLDMGQDVVLTQYRVAREPAFIRDELGKRAFVEQLDVTDAASLAAIGRKHDIEGIVHLAVPGLGALEPGEELRVNMLGLLTILENAREWGVTRVSIASSVAIYGGAARGPFREDMPLRTSGGNATEAFKRAIESLGDFYGSRTGIEVVMLRIAGIYGPLYHTMANLPSRLVHAAVNSQPPLLRGEHADDASDLCYVKDCAEGIALLQTAPTLNHRVYNLGAGRPASNRELAEAIAAVVPGFGVDFEPGHSRNRRDDAYMDLSRIHEDVGYAPQWPLAKAVADYVAWLRDGNSE